MGFKKNIIQVIYDRITNQIGEGGILNGIKYVRIGSVEDARKLNDYPVIIISLLGGEEKPSMPQLEMTDTVRISVTVVANKLQGENTLFNGGMSGVLDILENVLNVIDKKTSGELDTTFDGNVGSVTSRSYTIEEIDQMIICTLVFEMATEIFQIGGR